MRLTLVTVGSRGDVQPLVALGRGLQAAGHAVRLASHAEFESFVREHGLEFAAIPRNPMGVLRNHPENNAPREKQKFQDVFESYLCDWMAACWQAARDADAVLVAQLCFVGAYAAEKLNRPWLMLNHSPVTPTAVFPSIYWPRLPNLGGSFNRFTHWIDQQSFWWAMRAPINRSRHTALALPPLPFGGQAAQMRRDRVPVLYGFSSAIVPRPADWDPWVHVTGYWLLERAPDWQPPEELAAFLRAGPPPVYLGLGSVTDNAPARFLHTLLEGIARSGQRLILLAGKQSLDGVRLPQETLPITSTAFDWLFPQLAGVISHGGPGTLAYAFQVGVPAMAIPFFGDQYFWGRRAHELGVGPAPIPIEQVTAENVAEAVARLATDAGMRQRAAALGARLRAEDGVANAVAAIHKSLR